MSQRLELASNKNATTWEDITALVDDWEEARFGGTADHGNIDTGSGFNLADDAGVRTLPYRRRVRLIETSTTPDAVMWQGRTVASEIARGVFFHDDAKRFDVMLVDANADLGGIAFAQTPRPAETDFERIQFFLDTYVGVDLALSARTRPSTGIDPDPYFSGSTATPVDLAAHLYEQIQLGDVFKHIAQESGRQFFLTKDHQLWYDVNGATTYAAGISITDDGADGITSFAPGGPPRANEDATELVTAVRFRYSGNRVVQVTRPGVETSNDQWRIAVTDESVTTLARATARANKILDEFDHAHTTYMCTVDLPSSKVDQISWGMTVSFRSAACQILTPTLFRVSRCSWQWLGPDRWRAHLELAFPNKFGRRIIGNAPAPVTPPTTPFIPGDNVDEGGDPGEGTIYGAVDNGWFEVYLNGTLLTALPSGDPDENNIPATIPDGVLVAGENVLAVKVGNGTGGAFWLGNETWLEVRIFNEDGDLLAYTTTATKVWEVENDAGTIGGEPTNWETTAFDDSGWDNAIDVTGTTANIAAVAPIAPARKITTPDAPSAGTHAFLLVWLARITFSSGIVTPNVPAPGQRVTESLVGDGTTTCFETNYPYVENSLEVYVDGLQFVPQQTDPETGAFCLPTAPANGATVVLIYTAASGTSTGAGNNPNPPPTSPSTGLTIWKPLTALDPDTGNYLVVTADGNAVMVET